MTSVKLFEIASFGCLKLWKRSSMIVLWAWRDQASKTHASLLFFIYKKTNIVFEHCGMYANYYSIICVWELTNHKNIFNQHRQSLFLVLDYNERQGFINEHRLFRCNQFKLVQGRSDQVVVDVSCCDWPAVCNETTNHRPVILCQQDNIIEISCLKPDHMIRVVCGFQSRPAKLCRFPPHARRK